MGSTMSLWQTPESAVAQAPQPESLVGLTPEQQHSTDCWDDGADSGD